MVEAAAALFAEFAAAAGAADLGAEIGEAWERGRYRAEWIDTGNASQSTIADSIEVTGGWPQLEATYDAVMAAIRPLCTSAMAHWSHFYSDGCGVYFIFRIEDDNPASLQARYERVWTAVIDTSERRGGTISRHHGVGLVRAHRLPHAMGSAFGLLRRVKAALDPGGILNPGKLVA